MLYPGKITVYLHDTIDTTQSSASEVDALAAARAGHRCSAGGRIAEELEATQERLR